MQRNVLQSLLFTGAFLLAVLRAPAAAGMPGVDDVKETVAKARQACEESVAKTEKKLGKKKGDKVQREYRQAIADAWTAFAYVLETQAILCKRLKNAEALKLWESYQKEVGTITQEKLASLHKQDLVEQYDDCWREYKQGEYEVVDDGFITGRYRVYASQDCDEFCRYQCETEIRRSNHNTWRIVVLSCSRSCDS